MRVRGSFHIRVRCFFAIRDAPAIKCLHVKEASLPDVDVSPEKGTDLLRHRAVFQHTNLQILRGHESLPRFFSRPAIDDYAFIPSGVLWPGEISSVSLTIEIAPDDEETTGLNG